MSVATLLTKHSPSFGPKDNVIEFDAVLQDTFDAEVEITDYPIEVGARVADGRVVRPLRWTLTGVVSNNPLSLKVTDFTGLINSLVPDSGILSTLTGLSAGFLAGSDNTRSAAALVSLVSLLNSKDTFTVNAGDITLVDMVLEKLTRTKNPRNENTLVFQATLRELITLDTVSTANKVKVSKLRDGDPAKNQIAPPVNNGAVPTSSASSSVNSSISSGIGRIF